MPGADDVRPIEVAVAQRPVIVRANVSNGIKFSSQVKDHDRTVANLDEQAFSIGQVCCTNFVEIHLARLELSVIEHISFSIYKVIGGGAQPVNTGFEHFQREQGAFQAYRAQVEADQVEDVLFGQLSDFLQRFPDDGFEQ